MYYPPIYSQETWHYQDANIDLIRRVISGFNWDKAFLNTNTVLNKLCKKFSHESLIKENRYMPWFSSTVKSFLKQHILPTSKIEIISCSKNRLNILQDRLKNLIETEK